MKGLNKRLNKITLGDDGELHQILDDPASEREAIFCVHCSAANLPSAKFCNECGRSLTEQQIELAITDNLEWAKVKNDQVPKPKLATYGPDQYTLRKKTPVARILLLLILAALMFGNAVFPGIFAEIMRGMNAHSTETMLVIIVIIVAGIGLWLSRIND